MAVRILIDEREKGSRVPESLHRLGASVEFGFLTVGDYIVSSQIAIERKTISDLVNSVYDGRLFLQCDDLVRYYATSLIILEGNILNQYQAQPAPTTDEESSKSRIAQLPLIYEALTRVVLEFRIPMLPSPAPDYTAQLLMMIADRARREGSINGPLLRRIRKQNSFHVQQLSVLSSLPGVGDKIALRMLKKFGTPARTLEASVAELSMIPGLGTNRAIRIRKILDNYDSINPTRRNSEIQKTLGDSEERGEQL